MPQMHEVDYQIVGSEMQFVEIELAVAVVGGFSAPLLFLTFANLSYFSVVLYTVVFIIGMLVGLEIPLLMRILQDEMDFKDLVSRVLAFDYIGALAASLLFPIFFVPRLGLTRTSLIFGMLNAAVGIWGTWLLLPFADDFEGQRRASAWNSATSVAAGLLVLIDPLRVIRDHRRLEALLAADPSPGCATLAAAEQLLVHAAGSEEGARGPRAHILGALTTVGLGLVLGYALQRPESAAINTTIGVFLSEIMIASRPLVAVTRLQRYRSGDLGTATTPPAAGLALGLVPLRLDSGYGAALSGTF